MIRTVALLAFAFALPLPAAELVVRDIRLGAATRPFDFDFSYTGIATSADGSDAFEGGLGLEAGGRWSFARAGDAIGLVVGTDIMLDALSYGGGDGLATSWLRLCAGPAIAIGDDWTLAACAGAQYGVSALSLPATAAAPDFSANGTATGYDLRIEATWMATRRFGLGAVAGWLIASHDLSGDADITVEQSGWFAGLAAVWRFADAPPRLE